MSTDRAARLQRLQAAERRANQRDRDIKYGNHRQRPAYGAVAIKAKPGAGVITRYRWPYELLVAVLLVSFLTLCLLAIIKQSV